MSEGWIAEAWTFTRTSPSFGVGFGTVVRVSVGGESGEGRVRRRAFIVSAILILRDEDELRNSSEDCTSC